MSELNKMIANEQAKRDRRILAWLRKDKSFSWIAEQLAVSRQRVQQIAERLGWKKA